MSARRLTETREPTAPEKGSDGIGYATVDDVAAGFRALSTEETARCEALLQEAAVLVDACSPGADPARKKLVSCRMVRRLLGEAEGGALYPTGATQGSASALGYTQSWSMAGGAVGEMYLSKLEKRLLGVGDKLGARSPLEELP